MPSTLEPDTVFSEAMERERDYDWMGAAEIYEKVYPSVSGQDAPKLGELYEYWGYALFKAAMQAENSDEFRYRMEQAIAKYQQASENYPRLSQQKHVARTLRCNAMIAYIGYWLSADVSEKKRLIEESWRLAREALKIFWETSDATNYGRTYTQLSVAAFLGFFLKQNPEEREKTLREAVEYGEHAITLLSTLRDPFALARVYVKTATNLEALAYHFLESDVKERESRKALGYWLKALESYEVAAFLELGNFNYWELFGYRVGSDDAVTNWKKALEYARKTKDRFAIGWTLDCLAYHFHWKTVSTDDPDEREELANKKLQYAEEARHYYSSISFTSPRADAAWVEAPQTETYFWLSFSETDLRKRRDLLDKSLGAAADLMERAEKSGYLYAMFYAHHVFSHALLASAEMETNSDEKKRSLEEALRHRNESAALTRQLAPFAYWEQGLMQYELASIKSELAELAEDQETKRKLLQEAILDGQNSIKLERKYTALMGEAPALFVKVGTDQYQQACRLKRLYVLTSKKEYLGEAADAYSDAAESFRKPNLPSRMAECYWQAAWAFDVLGEYLKSAESFTEASKHYTTASEKIPQLQGFYQAHSSYMQAWSEIESARYLHSRQEYGVASEHYERAANLHKSTREWSYLATNYSAWAYVARAEDLSRKELAQEAIQALKESSRLFSESKKTIVAELSKIESSDERQLATELVEAADLRQEYTKARILLEEAKILDKKGEHYIGSEKYSLAAETLEGIMLSLKSPQDLREIKLILVLAKAWQNMSRAEAEDLPELYLEASELFNQAKELSPNETSKMLAAGHSRFCKALEAGTRFSDTGEETLHAMATQNLESAAKFYLKAGFKHAAEYTTATKLLFDAYAYMNSASKESDQEKRAKFFLMAEKMLQASAEAYSAAEQLGKREDILKLLEKVKKEKELAISLIEVLRAPTILSATTAFSTPTATHEKAVGLERFENADIQASLIIPRKQLKVGEDLNVEIELVNAGRGAAQLIKIEEFIPKGFELSSKPEAYRVEDAYLNMKGKRLDALKTEEVKLILKPNAQGLFTLKPRILYLDESGRYKSHEAEPVEISVKELGISGWIKGTKT